MIYLSKDLQLSIEQFIDFLDDKAPHLKISEQSAERLDETRSLIQYLLDQRIKVYGLTTGFADLRNTSILPHQAATLSSYLIRSHDAGIGAPLPNKVTLGAMAIRAHSLAKGYSGFSKEALEILVSMINHRIIPEIPCTGSLGASGDLAYLARLGRAMMGEEVPVSYQGKTTTAKKALQSASIPFFQPQAKEGLALTNGTPFMASMLAIAYTKEITCLENLMSLTGLFLNATSAVPTAFYESLQTVRLQTGQIHLAQHIKESLVDSPINFKEVQNDYSTRCLPQIYGPRFELIFEQRQKVERELNAVTDNPLIFRDEEISSDVDPAYILPFNGSRWAILSGGNFHGENLTAIADLIALSNAKIALTIERQITYLMNPFRNKQALPTYLIADAKEAGLRSGLMITQYTANALTHKIGLLGQPAGLSNITSANESEDIVSYGATACQKLLEQTDLLEQLLSIYLIATAQAYALKRPSLSSKNPLVEASFEAIQSVMDFPRTQEESFDQLYTQATRLLRGKTLIQESWIQKFNNIPFSPIEK